MDDKGKNEFIKNLVTLDIYTDMIGTGDDKLYRERIPTGFPKLDDCMGGGLSAGLHCLGAVPSLGKSTLVLQMVDQMAEHGTQSIVFSLEMPIVDLATKAVSRQLYRDYKDQATLLQTSSQLIDRKAAAKFSDGKWAAIQAVARKIKIREKNICIVECGAKAWTAEDVERYVRDYAEVYEAKPVVIVDYLQILASPPHRGSLTDKQIADESLSVLKRLSDSLKIPIMLISSFNRENYETEVSFRSFKDSGSIEYSCDTVMGLQLRGIGKKGFDGEAAKSRDPRDVELAILKQRNGPTGAKIPYKFWTCWSTFVEDDLPSTATEHPKQEDFVKRRF